jgi:cytochrome o ubiquinol oxidase subunit 1
MGIYLAGFIFLIGFAFVWHIYWLIAVGFIASIVIFLKRAFDEEPEYIVPAAEVEKIEQRRKKQYA